MLFYESIKLPRFKMGGLRVVRAWVHALDYRIVIDKMDDTTSYVFISTLPSPSRSDTSLLGPRYGDSVLIRYEMRSR